MSNSWQPLGLQHARPPCPSPTPGAIQTHVHQVSDAIQPSHPLLSPSPAFSLSQHHGLFQWIGSSHQVAEVLEFQLQHQSFQWVFRTDFFRIDRLDLLAVQGTLKSLLQHHSSKASILQHSVFFIVQLSYPYMTTGKIIALTRWTFVGKVMSLLFFFFLKNRWTLSKVEFLLRQFSLDLPFGFVVVSVTKSCLTLCDPMDCTPPGSSVHGISQARILEWVAVSFASAICFWD